MDQERAFIEKCSVFHENQTLEEYTEDVKRYLVLCSYHYSDEGAGEWVQKYRKTIAEMYSDKVSVEDCAIDIGYCCG